jgi:hypothetical protein
MLVLRACLPVAPVGAGSAGIFCAAVERKPIYRQQETMHGFAGGMFGISAEEMEHVGDDRIGRALDRLFDANRGAQLTEVVVTVGQRFGVKFDEFHNDGASISFCGKGLYINNTYS